MKRNLPEPRTLPPLDPGFRPMYPVLLKIRAELKSAGVGIPIVIGLEKSDGTISRYSMEMLPEGHIFSEWNFLYVERIVKFLLWQRGAWRIFFGGPPDIADRLRKIYSPGGERDFDRRLMGEDIYGKQFRIESCSPEDVPDEKDGSVSLGRHLDGYRIGFDLGASDRKAAAVAEGEVVFSKETVWEPRKYEDPEYHYREITAAIREAASHLPRVDAIGGSSAGVYVNNEVRVASLFRAVSKERYLEIRKLFLRLGKEFDVPLEIANDGDVTALAGSMSLGEGSVLGIALGSSLAGGYVNAQGCITGWLNELAFTPVDLRPDAPKDEWSGDRGCGVSYLSQQSVFRLAAAAGIQLDPEMTDAGKLHYIQEFLEAGHSGAESIWETMGIYLGYTLALYHEFYRPRHVLILGRCTSGRGGPILLSFAQKILDEEFPEIARCLKLHLPDESIRRVGQAIAAASLPAIPGGAKP